MIGECIFVGLKGWSRKKAGSSDSGVGPKGDGLCTVPGGRCVSWIASHDHSGLVEALHNDGDDSVEQDRGIEERNVVVHMMFLPRRSIHGFAMPLHNPHLGDCNRGGCPPLNSTGLGLFVGASKTRLSLAISCVVACAPCPGQYWLPFFASYA